MAKIGNYTRKGISIIELFKMFPDDETAKQWFIKTYWPDGIVCRDCGSTNVNENTKHPSMPFRCRDCRKRFSPKTGTVMQGSKLGYQTWAIAIYLISTNLKGVSSMKLHRDLNVTQKTAWYMAHRIRKALENAPEALSGTIEVDETYI